MDDSRNKKCPSCGAEQPENAVFCGECGAKMSGEAREQSSDENQNRYQSQYQPQMYSQYEMNPPDTPLSLGDYLLMMIAFMVPVVGFILMIVWSVSSSTNTNRKNFSRAMLIIRIVSTVISVILFIAFAAFFYSMLEEALRNSGDIEQYFREYFYEYQYDMSIFRHFLQHITNYLR